MSSPAPNAPTRTPLSLQTEVAKQQQLTTIVMLLLLLGPITLAVAGLIAGMAGRIPRRMAWCALGGTLALAVAGWFWRDYQTVALTLWATGGTTYRALQAGGGSIDYGGIARQIWPPLWAWWRMSLLAAPFAALNILSNRVRTAEELEQERLDRAERSAAERDCQARASVAKVPVNVTGAMVLGVPLGVGDLPWATGALFTYPADSLARHGAIIGSSGMGKSETMLRLAAGARQTYGWKVFVIDCKGERALQERFAATMRAAGATTIGSFPEQPLRGWQGDSVALLNRLLAVLDYSEPYYKDLTKMLLNLTLEAPGGPPRSSQDLLAGMVLSRLRQRYAGRPEVDEIDGLRTRDAAAAYNRYRAFFKALGSGLDGAEDTASWSFDTVDAGYILLDGLSLKDQTASFGRYLIEDFAHYAARRKPADQRVLLIIDEYPVIAQSGAGTASLFEMVRFHGASIIVTGQSYAGMGEGFDRILGAAETLILHRCGDPDLLLPRAGQRLRFTRRIGFSERGMGRGAREYATGAGYLSLDEALKIHPNDVKELPPGECYVIAGGRAQRVLVKRASVSDTQPTAPTRPTSLVLASVIEVERPMRVSSHDQPDHDSSDAAPPAAAASPVPTTYADEDLG